MNNFSRWIVLLGAGAGIVYLTGCAATTPTPVTKSNITQAPFGTTPEGKAVDIYTLVNAKGAEARICTYGGIVVSLKMLDRNGRLGDVVLGYDNLAGYIKDNPFFGALIGRYGNRIAGGKFTLDGRQYTLAKNNGENHLHGGVKGFDKVVWSAQAVSSRLGPALKLTYVSKDGEEGYPGNLTVTAVYTLTEDNALRVDFTAITDQPTVCNLTHHSYFNLADGGASDVLNHEMMIAADKFTPVDATLIPTGELRPLKGSPLDFSTPAKIGARINDDDEQLKLGKGYDHNYVLSKPANQLGLAARVYDPTSGRVMEVFTTEPGMQFYSGNFLDGSITGKGGNVYQLRHGFCLEPQHFPDSPNQPAFPSTVLNPGQTYQNTIVYKFSTR
jgi:aldose 1-epimerase